MNYLDDHDHMDPFRRDAVQWLMSEANNDVVRYQIRET